MNPTDQASTDQANSAGTNSAGMINIFGPPKATKTTQSLTVPGLVIGADEDIYAIGHNCLGITPTTWPWPELEAFGLPAGVPASVRTLPDLLSVLRYLNDTGMFAYFGSIVINDGSHLASASLAMWNQMNKKSTNGKEDFGWKYGQLNEHMLTIASLVRHWNRLVIFNAHVVQPDLERGLPGGPSYGSKPQAEVIPGWFDTNLLVVKDAEYPDPFGLRVSVFCDSFNKSWVTGDRNGAFGRRSPFSLREGLRAASTSLPLPRYPGLEWQDDAVDLTARLLHEGADLKVVAREVGSAFHAPMKPGKPSALDLQVRWAFQDGLARFFFDQRASLFDFDEKDCAWGNGRSLIAGLRPAGGAAGPGAGPGGPVKPGPGGPSKPGPVAPGRPALVPTKPGPGVPSKPGPGPSKPGPGPGKFSPGPGSSLPVLKPQPPALDENLDTQGAGDNIPY